MPLESLKSAGTQQPPLGRAFRWFLVGRAVSILGSSMSSIALAFAVLQTTGSARDLSYVLTAATIPKVALLLVGGGIADRFPRDKLLRVTNTLSGLSQACMAVSILTKQSLVVLVVFAITNGTIAAFSQPALSGVVPQLVEQEGIQRANSILATTRNLSRVIGPTVAGLLVATVGGGWAISFDAFSFFVAATCMTFVNLPTKPKKKTRGLLREIGVGWTYFRSTRWLWTGTAVFAIINAIQAGVWQVLGPTIAEKSIGAAQWGVVLSTGTVGMLVMSAVMIRMTMHRPMVSGMLWLAVSSAPLILLGLRANVAFLAAGALIAGLASGYSAIAWNSVRHGNIPANMMSRATSYDDFGAYAGIPIGQLSVIPLAAAIGTTHVALYGGLIYLVTALLPLALHSVRSIHIYPPDSVPEPAAPVA